MMRVFQTDSHRLAAGPVNQATISQAAPVGNDLTLPRLLTPGPMALSDTVKFPMLTDLGSRGAEIRRLTAEVRSMLAAIANGGDSHETVLVQGSGTFAIEAAIGTFCRISSRVLVIVNGIYGLRAVRILRLLGIPCETITCAANICPDIEAIAERLRSGSEFTHMFFVHCETTTGILNPLKSLCALARMHGVTTIVDAMSSYGGHPIDMQRDHIDVLVSSGNKCVESPPGIAFVIAPRELLEGAEGNNRSFCLDLHDQWRGFDRDGEWRCTPPTHILQALHAALLRLHEETIQGRLRRYERVRERVTSGLTALGFVPVVKKQHRAIACIAFSHPEWRGHEAEAFARYCDALQSEKLHIYTKLHQPTSSFRVGCMGAIKDHWIDALIEVTADHMKFTEVFKR